MPLSEATASATAINGTANVSLRCASSALKASITPAVRLICEDGTTQEIASVGRMKIASTNATATNVARGNCRAGSRSSSTWTALTSTPAYVKKLLTISTTLARPFHAGSRCAAFIGAAGRYPWPR